MRLFLALQLPEAHRVEIGRFMDKVRPRLPKAHWVRPKNLHMTLAFLGEVEPEEADLLDQPVAAVCARSPRFEVSISGGGTFPPGKPARVVWLGFEGGAPLLDLQEAVAQRAAETLDQEPDLRPFRPHVTLARVQQKWSRTDGERFEVAASRPFGQSFMVSEVALMESRQYPEGPRYSTLHRYPLGRQ